MVVVEALPFLKLRLQVHVVFVGKQLVELLLVGPVRPLDLPVQPRRPHPNVPMADAEILDMPMELGLELVPVVRADRADAEREARDHVVHEPDSVVLRMADVDFQRADARRVVDCRVLKAAHRLALGVCEGEELDVDLHVVAGDLFLVPVPEHRPLGRVAG